MTKLTGRLHFPSACLGAGRWEDIEHSAAYQSFCNHFPAERRHFAQGLARALLACFQKLPLENSEYFLRPYGAVEAGLLLASGALAQMRGTIPLENASFEERERQMQMIRVAVAAGAVFYLSLRTVASFRIRTTGGRLFRFQETLSDWYENVPASDACLILEANKDSRASEDIARAYAMVCRAMPSDILEEISGSRHVDALAFLQASTEYSASKLKCFPRFARFLETSEASLMQSEIIRMRPGQSPYEEVTSFQCQKILSDLFAGEWHIARQIDTYETKHSFFLDHLSIREEKLFIDAVKGPAFMARKLRERYPRLRFTAEEVTVVCLRSSIFRAASDASAYFVPFFKTLNPGHKARTEDVRPAFEIYHPLRFLAKDSYLAGRLKSEAAEQAKAIEKMLAAGEEHFQKAIEKRVDYLTSMEVARRYEPAFKEPEHNRLTQKTLDKFQAAAEATIARKEEEALLETLKKISPVECLFRKIAGLKAKNRERLFKDEVERAAQRLVKEMSCKNASQKGLPAASKASCQSITTTPCYVPGLPDPEGRIEPVLEDAPAHTRICAAAEPALHVESSAPSASKAQTPAHPSVPVKALELRPALNLNGPSGLQILQLPVQPVKRAVSPAQSLLSSWAKLWRSLKAVFKRIAVSSGSGPRPATGAAGEENGAFWDTPANAPVFEESADPSDNAPAAPDGRADATPKEKGAAQKVHAAPKAAASPAPARKPRASETLNSKASPSKDRASKDTSAKAAPAAASKKAVSKMAASEKDAFREDAAKGAAAKESTSKEAGARKAGAKGAAGAASGRTVAKKASVKGTDVKEAKGVRETKETSAKEAPSKGKGSKKVSKKALSPSAGGAPLKEPQNSAPRHPEDAESGKAQSSSLPGAPGAAGLKESISEVTEGASETVEVSGRLLGEARVKTSAEVSPQAGSPEDNPRGPCGPYPTRPGTLSLPVKPETGADPEAKENALAKEDRPLSDTTSKSRARQENHECAEAQTQAEEKTDVSAAGASLKSSSGGLQKTTLKRLQKSLSPRLASQKRKTALKDAPEDAKSLK